MDRSASTFTQEELEAFCRQHGMTGGYVGTSAYTGEGVGELVERLKGQIPWDQMPRTTTTETFKRIKEYVLSLKGDAERRPILVRPAELEEKLKITD
jgi:hypothetical protein